MTACGCPGRMQRFVFLQTIWRMWLAQPHVKLAPARLQKRFFSSVSHMHCRSWQLIKEIVSLFFSVLPLPIHSRIHGIYMAIGYECNVGTHRIGWTGSRSCSCDLEFWAGHYKPNLGLAHRSWNATNRSLVYNDIILIKKY